MLFLICLSCLFLALSIDAFLEYKRNGMGPRLLKSLGGAITLIGFTGAFEFNCENKLISDVFSAIFMIPGGVLLLAGMFMSSNDALSPDNRNNGILISLMLAMMGLLTSFLIDILYGVIQISFAVAFLIWTFVAYKS
jgi:hypothetical protein